MSPRLALLRHRAMSDLSPECAPQRISYHRGPSLGPGCPLTTPFLGLFSSLAMMISGHRMLNRLGRDIADSLGFRSLFSLVFWRSKLWAATELPIKNQTGGDWAADVTIREPCENDLIFSASETPPDIKDAKKHFEILQELNKKVKRKCPPTNFATLTAIRSGRLVSIWPRGPFDRHDRRGACFRGRLYGLRLPLNP